MNRLMYKPYKRLGGIYLYFSHRMTYGLSNHVIRIESITLVVCQPTFGVPSVTKSAAL